MIQTQSENEKIVCVVTRRVNYKGEKIVTFKQNCVEAKRAFHLI